MKVLHVYRTFFPETQGGGQEAIRQICASTRALGVEPSIFTLARQPEPEQVLVDQTPVIRGKCVFEIASCDFGSPGAVQRYRECARAADLLHFHFPWPFGDVLGLLAGRKPAVVTYHSDIVRQRTLARLYSPLRDAFFRRVDAVVTTSPQYRAGSAFLRDFPGRCEVIPLGMSEQARIAPDAGLLQRWRERVGEGFFFFVGVLRYYKGLHFLIEAARRSGLPVVIAGDGPERDSLQRQAEGLKNVHFVGFIDDADKYALLELSRAVVFPSHLRSEAFGMTLLEGLMCRRPLISTEIGTGTSFVNQDGVSGFVVPPESPSAFADAMQRLAASPELARQMGEAGYQRYRKHFTPEVVGQGYTELYRSVLEARRG